MTDRREHHERHAREFSIQDGVIEIQGPDGVKQIAAPSDWGIHDITAVRKLLEAAGYTVAVPETGALFAYAPKVHADEATPFDSADSSLCERLSLAPGIRTMSTQKTARGHEMAILDYTTGQTHRVSVDETQPNLREVSNEGK